ncbi:MAG: hypothetical protein JSR64_15845 [Nitrospira sp.]|nr:hypothetical protein [Nitrospira sp.]
MIRRTTILIATLVSPLTLALPFVTGTGAHAQAPTSKAEHKPGPTAEQDVSKVEGAAKEIQAQNDEETERLKAQDKAAGKDPNSDSVLIYLIRNVTQKDTKAWMDQAAHSRALIKNGHADLAQFGMREFSASKYREYLQALKLSQLGKQPNPIDSPHVKTCIAKLRVTARLLGASLPDAITREWVLKQEITSHATF